MQVGLESNRGTSHFWQSPGVPERKKMILRLLKKRLDTAAEPRTPAVSEGDRIYAIGDVHGRFDLLSAMFQRIYEDAEARRDGRKVRLVLLGDYVDRGDDSARVIQTLTQISGDEPDRLVCLMGNHESAMLGFIDDPVHQNAWLEYGAAQTLASFGIPVPADSSDPEEMVKTRDLLVDGLGDGLAFVRATKPYFQSGNVVFVHAGLNPVPDHQFRDVQAMLWGHPEFRVPEPVPGLRVVHGHYDDYEPVVHSGRVCIDTGAYYSGVLTAIRLDEDQEILKVNALNM